MAIQQPTVEQRTEWQKALGEDPQLVDTAIPHLKEWLLKQPHLPSTIEDQFLMNFFRGCKYSLEKTKKKLDMYFTMRTAIPEFFAVRWPFHNRYKESQKFGYVAPVPQFTPDGYRVVILALTDYEPFKYDFELGCNCMLTCLDVSYLLQDVWGGEIIIFDMGDLELGHLTRITAPTVKKFLTCIQEAYPARLKQIHVVRSPPFIHKLVNLFKLFLKEKLRKRIYIHGEDLSALYEHVPREMLPAELGGDGGSVDDMVENWYSEFESHKDWIKQQENRKSDESRRPGKPRTQGDLFGLEGSFRQLSVD